MPIERSSAKLYIISERIIPEYSTFANPGLIVADRNADIFFKDQLAGTLEETAAAGTRFTYTRDGRPQSPAASRSAAGARIGRQASTRSSSISAPKAGCARSRRAARHIGEQDDFGLLLRYGADCIGAVGVRPPPGQSRRRCLPGPRSHRYPGRTISGIQKKLLVVKQSGRRIHAGGRDGTRPLHSQVQFRERHATPRAQ